MHHSDGSDEDDDDSSDAVRYSSACRLLNQKLSPRTPEKILTRRKKTKKKVRQNGAEKSPAAIPKATMATMATILPEPATLPQRPSPIAIRIRTTTPTRKRRFSATRIRIRACRSEKKTATLVELFKLPRINSETKNSFF
jgi:hypothetical protein